jgi:hypothetical protein
MMSAGYRVSCKNGNPGLDRTKETSETFTVQHVLLHAGHALGGAGAMSEIRDEHAMYEMARIIASAKFEGTLLPGGCRLGGVFGRG